MVVGELQHDDRSALTTVRFASAGPAGTATWELGSGALRITVDAHAPDRLVEIEVAHWALEASDADAIGALLATLLGDRVAARLVAGEVPAVVEPVEVTNSDITRAVGRVVLAVELAREEADPMVRTLWLADQLAGIAALVEVAGPSVWTADAIGALVEELDDADLVPSMLDSLERLVDERDALSAAIAQHLYEVAGAVRRIVHCVVDGDPIRERERLRSVQDRAGDSAIERAREHHRAAVLEGVRNEEPDRAAGRGEPDLKVPLPFPIDPTRLLDPQTRNREGECGLIDREEPIVVHDAAATTADDDTPLEQNTQSAPLVDDGFRELVATVRLNRDSEELVVERKAPRLFLQLVDDGVALAEQPLRPPTAEEEAQDPDASRLGVARFRVQRSMISADRWWIDIIDRGNDCGQQSPPTFAERQVRLLRSFVRRADAYWRAYQAPRVSETDANRLWREAVTCLNGAQQAAEASGSDVARAATLLLKARLFEVFDPTNPRVITLRRGAIEILDEDPPFDAQWERFLGGLDRSPESWERTWLDWAREPAAPPYLTDLFTVSRRHS